VLDIGYGTRPRLLSLLGSRAGDGIDALTRCSAAVARGSGDDA
jgi:hypothetical protein